MNEVEAAASALLDVATNILPDAPATLATHGFVSAAEAIVDQAMQVESTAYELCRAVLKALDGMEAHLQAWRVGVVELTQEVRAEAEAEGCEAVDLTGALITALPTIQALVSSLDGSKVIAWTKGVKH